MYGNCWKDEEWLGSKKDLTVWAPPDVIAGLRQLLLRLHDAAISQHRRLPAAALRVQAPLRQNPHLEGRTGEGLHMEELV